MSIYEGMLAEMPEDLVDGLIKEIQTGWNMEAVSAEINNKRLGVANSSSQRNAIEGLGRLRMEIDPTSFHYWGQRLGYDCWKDQDFLRRYEQQVPECRVNCGGTRLQVGYGSAPTNTKFRKVYQ